MEFFYRVTRGLFDVTGITRPEPENETKVFLAFYLALILFFALGTLAAVLVAFSIGRM